MALIIRIAWFKDAWDNGRKVEAIFLLLRSIPNLTFPGGANEMDLRIQKYGSWKFTGPMASVTWWRELWHFLGGIGLTLAGAPLLKLISFGISLLSSHFRPLQIGEASFLASFWVGVIFFFSEFILENPGTPRDLKNVIDWLAWVSGSSAVTLVLMAVFGPGNLL